MMKSPITTHVLDTVRGRPAAGMSVTLEMRAQPAEWKELARGTTDSDGRIDDLLAPTARLTAGPFRMTFDTAGYFRSIGISGFYPSVTVTFDVDDPDHHYHIPLLLSPFGYSTYRGS